MCVIPYYNTRILIGFMGGQQTKKSKLLNILQPFLSFSINIEELFNISKARRRDQSQPL